MKTKTRKPWQRDGSTGFFREDGTRACTGSQMGRRSILPDDRTEAPKLKMERLRLYDNAYDEGGAYWGGPGNLWCAYGDGEEIQIEIYVRADNRDEAKRKVRESLPLASFFR